MKGYKEEEDVVIGEEETQEDKTAVFDDEAVLKKSMVGSFKPKSDFLNENVRVKITGLALSKFGKPVLMGIIDGEPTNINISEPNKNTLIDLFGEKLSGWKGKEVMISGSVYEGKNGMSDGVTLKLKAI